MFLTKERDYAVRIVRCLADMELKAVKTICDREHIPQPFAYKILKRLERSGIVSSQRGAAGGYVLKRPIESLTLLDVVGTIEGHLVLNECLKTGVDCPNNPCDNKCGVHVELVRVQKLLVDALTEKKMDEII